MVKIVISDGQCLHSGTVCTGNVSGTITVGTNIFVTIENKLIMIENGTLEVPTHLNPPCTPGIPQSHSFTPNTFNQSFVTIEGKKICTLGDSYSGDATEIDNQGSNSFVDIS